MIIESNKFKIRMGVLDSCDGTGSEVYVPDDVRVIGSDAFYDNRTVERITVGSNLRAVKKNAFRYCRSLRRVDITDLRAWCYAERENEYSSPFFCSRGGDVYLDRVPLTELVIPEDFERVGNYAFAYCNGLTSVTVEGDRTDIGRGAFDGCPLLASVRFPGLCDWFGASAVERGALDGDGYWELLADGEAVTEVVIPERITHVPSNLFNGCKSIRRVILHGNVRSIGAGAFEDCPNLSYVEIGDIVNWCSTDGGDNGAFPEANRNAVICLNGEPLKSVRVPEGVEHIGAYRFAGMTLGDGFVIPDSVKHIGEGAFLGAVGLGYVSVPKGVTEISDVTFAYSDLYGILLPDGITRIGVGAFENCVSLKSVSIPDSVTEICDNAFLGCGDMERVSFGSGLRCVDKCAFKECGMLVEAALPDSVRELGDYAFYNCGELKGLNIPESLNYISRDAFKGCDNLNVLHVSMRKLRGLRKYFTDGIGLSFIDHAFRGFALRYCRGELKNGDASDWMDFALYGSLQYIKNDISDPMVCRLLLDKEVLTLGMAERALENVEGAETRALLLDFIGSQRGDIPSEGFGFDRFFLDDGAECESENVSTSREKRREKSFKSFFGGAFWGRKKKNERAEEPKNGDFELSVSNGTVTVVKYVGDAEDAVIPAYIDGFPVVAVGDGAFRGNAEIKSVTVSHGVTEIGAHAFEGCTALCGVSIPESVSQLGEGAFHLCGALTFLKLPDSVRIIPKGAFSGCAGLKEIALGYSLKSIGAFAFADCSSLKRVYAYSAEAVGDFAFSGCAALEIFQCDEMMGVISDTAFLRANNDMFMRCGSDNYASRYAAKMGFEHGYDPSRRARRIYW